MKYDGQNLNSGESLPKAQPVISKVWQLRAVGNEEGQQHKKRESVVNITQNIHVHVQLRVASAPLGFGSAKKIREEKKSKV